MTTLVKHNGKQYKVSRVVMGAVANQVANVVNVLTPIFVEEILRTRILQFWNERTKNNELWMDLQTVAPAQLPDATIIEIIRADNRQRYLEHIWQGTYGQMPAIADRIDVNNIVVPHSNVQIIEGENLIVNINSAALFDIAASGGIEMMAEELIEYRV